MKPTATFRSSSRTTDINTLLKHQVLWLLLLRVIFYTLILGINFLFGRASLNIILIPKEAMIFLLLSVYLSSINAAIYIQKNDCNIRKAGFIQIVLDTFFATILVYYTGLSLSKFTIIYLFPIITGGLLFSKRGGLIAAAVSTLLYATLLLLEITRNAVPYYILKSDHFEALSIMAALNHFSTHGLTFFLTAILSGLFSARLKKTEIILSSTQKDYDTLAILYKKIFDNIDIGIITTDESGNITSANRALCKITGFSEKLLLGNKIDLSFPGFTLNAPRIRQTADFIRPDGKKIRIGYSHVNLKPPNTAEKTAKEQHKIITLRDIGEIEQMEQQVKQAEKLAAIGLMSASIAHNFYNPLTAISGSAQLLNKEFQREDDDTIHGELTNIILRESNRMIATISDFLKFSRPETLEQQWFSLAGCLNEVMEVCKVGQSWPVTAQLIVDIDETIDIWADPGQMSTVLAHLIQNALAFCPPGKEQITISVTEHKSSETLDKITISITDNGPGIAEEIQEKIFEPFFTTRTNGTGLGLAVVKQIIERHNGELSVSQGKNGGACITLTLPLPS